MAPEASNAVTYKGVADESFQVIVPTNVLPDGLPVGIEFYRNVWVRIEYYFALFPIWLQNSLKNKIEPFDIGLRFLCFLLLSSI